MVRPVPRCMKKISKWAQYDENTGHFLAFHLIDSAEIGHGFCNRTSHVTFPAQHELRRTLRHSCSARIIEGKMSGIN